MKKMFDCFLLLYLYVGGIIFFSCGSGRVEEPAVPEKSSPTVFFLHPQKGGSGDTIKIIGKNFGNVKGDISVCFGSEEVELVDFHDKEVTVIVPEFDKTEEIEVFVKVGSLKSNAFSFLYKVNSIAKIEVIDKQIWFVNNAFNNSEYKNLPSDPDFYYFKNLPAIPTVQSVPFPWGKENFYSGGGGYITDNVYIEPGWNRPWVLQLSISTPGQGDTATGSPQYKTWYRTSKDNGASFSTLKQVIIKGHTSMIPIVGVEIGRNGYNVDFTRPIVRASNGEIMVPIGLHPWDDEKGRIYLPIPGAYLFQDAGVLIGKWLPDGSDMAWEFGGWLRIDHNKSTRGLSEPTIVELNENGKFAMVCRGSNLARLELPCHAWVSFSNDYCRTWSDPTPLAYNDGESLFVTTAHSTLFKSKVNGKTYWIGNLRPTNPQASFPRYPLVIGEIDLIHFGLIRETVIEIDTRQQSDGEQLQLSNFKILEHETNPEIIVVLTRREGAKTANNPSWYRIKLN